MLCCFFDTTASLTIYRVVKTSTTVCLLNTSVLENQQTNINIYVNITKSLFSFDLHAAISIDSKLKYS